MTCEQIEQTTQTSYTPNPMKLHFRLVACLSVGLLLIQPTIASAKLLLKITFDEAGEPGSYPASPYVVAADDFVPAGLNFQRMPGDDSAEGYMNVEKSDGFQGGLALQMKPGGGGMPQSLGYYAPSDLPDLPDTPKVGYQDYSGVTIEVIFRLDKFVPGIRELWGQWGSGGIKPNLSLRGTDRNNPEVCFNAAGATLKVKPEQSVIGQWHHLAGTVTTTGELWTLELFLDGKSIGRQEFEKPARQDMLVPYANFAIGTNVIMLDPKVTRARTPTGAIDAVALSLDALNAGSFVLPTGPQSTESADVQQ